MACHELARGMRTGWIMCYLQEASPRILAQEAKSGGYTEDMWPNFAPWKA
jgi:hypothetical protein